MPAVLPPAGFFDVFPIVVGVVMSLTGLGLIVMGLAALAGRAWRHGGVSTAAGLVLLFAGFWLVGVVG